MALHRFPAGRLLQPVQVSPPHPFPFGRLARQIIFGVFFKSLATGIGAKIVPAFMVGNGKICIIDVYLHPAYRVCKNLVFIC